MSTDETKPLIGLNLGFRSSLDGTGAFSYIPACYYNAIIEAGGVPLLIPPLTDADDIHSLLDSLDGVLFIGGEDLDPRNDGYLVHPAMRLLDFRRERFDRMLMRQVAHRKIPVLAIGCGMQLLNVSEGGNLFYHIPEESPKSLPHVDQTDPHHTHRIDVEPGSLMAKVYGDFEEIRVRSMHHMAVDEVAPGFAVTARCPDGVIEAIESTRDNWFAVGTQFHPESETASKVDIGVFEVFVEAAKDHMAVEA